MKNQKGFIPIIALIAILVIVASGSMFAYKKLKPTMKDATIISNDRDSQREALRLQFLKDPTLENFKVFCASVKNIEGKTTKQVLDSSREKMITVKQSLYYDEGMIDCQNLDNPNEGIYYFPLDNSILVELKDNDTNEIREAKIRFNNKVKNLMDTNQIKVVRFSVPAVNVPSPTELFENWETYRTQIPSYGTMVEVTIQGLSGYLEQREI